METENTPHCHCEITKYSKQSQGGDDSCFRRNDNEVCPPGFRRYGDGKYPPLSLRDYEVLEAIPGWAWILAFAGTTMRFVPPAFAGMETENTPIVIARLRSTRSNPRVGMDSCFRRNDNEVCPPGFRRYGDGKIPPLSLRDYEVLEANSGWGWILG